MNIEIRGADLSDIELLMKWRMTVLSEVFDIPENKDLSELERTNRLYYESAIPKGEHFACFAYADGKPIGCGGVCIHREMPSPDNTTGVCAYLMNVYISPNFRGRNAGKAIVARLTDYAREKKAGKIYLETSESGRKLYEKSGFVPMSDIMILPKTML